MKKLLAFFSLPLYPLYFALYMSVSLLAYNLGELYPPAALRSVLIAALAALALTALFTRLYQEPHRAAFAAGGWMFLLLSYGHIQILFRLGAWLLWVWLAALLFWAWIGFRWKGSPRVLTLALNVLWLAMLASPLLTTGQFLLRERQLLAAEILPANAEQLSPSVGGEPPDIYYIILDSYARADSLQTVYGFDNSPFLNEMKSLGFYAATCSQSNYDSTELSLSSSLNFDYLQNLAPRVEGGRDKQPLWALIQNNAAQRLLKQAGYETVSFATGFTWSELRDSDEYLAPPLGFHQLNEFEVLFLDTTLAQAFQPAYKEQEFSRYRERTQFVLKELPQWAKRKGAQFFFVHLLDPHPPFVFDENGATLGVGVYTNSTGYLAEVAYPQGYLNEVKFLNAQLPNLIRAIQANSSTPPVIVIQGDHGMWFQPPRFLTTNLNLYYFPQHEDALYPNVTPVNTFRLIFNEYLGANFPLLQDAAYDSAESYYDFTLIPNECQ
ncbi:MAG: hypothetical protein Fur002_20630 [Anaerolineales bacterium]